VHSVRSSIRRKQVEVADLNFTEENEFLLTLQRQGFVSMLASPVIFGDEIIGVIIAYTKQPHRFNNEERKVFQTLAEIGALAIQNARLYSRIFASEESLRRNEKADHSRNDRSGDRARNTQSIDRNQTPIRFA
jgi:GAF domain-containing protein